MGFAMLIVGENGAGKTHFIKNNLLALKQHKLIFNVSDEYTSLEARKDISLFYDKNLLLADATNRKNCILLIDEASCFFSYRGYSEDLYKLLQLRRHNNHLIVMTYLALKFVPEYTRILFNFAFVFKTEDKGKFVRENFPYIKAIPTKVHTFNYYKQF